MTEEKIVNESFSIDSLRTYVLNKDYVNAENALTKIIEMRSKGRLEFNLPPEDRELSKEEKFIETYQVTEQLASIITMWFCDSNYIMSEKSLFEIVINKDFIYHLFAASSYRNTNHIIRHLKLDQGSNHTKEDIRRFFLLYTPESTFDLPWTQLAKFMPKETAMTYVGLLNCMNIHLSETSTRRFSSLFSVAEDMPLINATHYAHLQKLCAPYFYLSNYTDPNKFKVKSWINANYKRFFDNCLSNKIKGKLSKVGSKVTNKASPKVVVINEKYTQNHAMRRCYHNWFTALKSKYNVVAMGTKPAMDDVSIEDFTKVVNFEGASDIEKTIEAVLKESPDIIIYSSVGMSHYGPLLANLRLAPKQIMLPGHPSSPYSDEIDYFVVDRMGLTDEDIANFMYEKPYIVEMGQYPNKLVDFELEEIKKDDSECNIVVNGVLQKVSSELIDVCKEIQNGIDKRVKFHFFMASANHDFEFYSAKSTLRRVLPSAEVHPTADYSKYMSTIAKCDFAIPTIPFGGTNSNIDVIRVGVPKLFILDKKDIPGATDYMLWKCVDEMSGFCESVGDLVSKAIEWGNNPTLLSEASARVIGIPESKYSFSTDENITDNTLVVAVEDILAH